MHILTACNVKFGQTKPVGNFNNWAFKLVIELIKKKYASYLE